MDHSHTLRTLHLLKCFVMLYCSFVITCCIIPISIASYLLPLKSFLILYCLAITVYLEPCHHNNSVAFINTFINLGPFKISQFTIHDSDTIVCLVPLEFGKP
ncbi:hypothetical protein ACJX0J_011666, partial [Zea mays]